MFIKHSMEKSEKDIIIFNNNGQFFQFCPFFCIIKFLYESKLQVTADSFKNLLSFNEFIGLSSEKYQTVSRI